MEYFTERMESNQDNTCKSQICLTSYSTCKALWFLYFFLTRHHKTDVISLLFRHWSVQQRASDWTCHCQAGMWIQGTYFLYSENCSYKEVLGFGLNYMNVLWRRQVLKQEQYCAFFFVPPFSPWLCLQVLWFTCKGTVLQDCKYVNILYSLCIF